MTAPAISPEQTLFAATTLSPVGIAAGSGDPVTVAARENVRGAKPTGQPGAQVGVDRPSAPAETEESAQPVLPPPRPHQRSDAEAIAAWENEGDPN